MSRVPIEKSWTELLAADEVIRRVDATRSLLAAASGRQGHAIGAWGPATIAVDNLLMLAEDILVMALQMRPWDEIVAIPEGERTREQPTKYRARPGTMKRRVKAATATRPGCPATPAGRPLARVLPPAQQACTHPIAQLRRRFRCRDRLRLRLRLGGRGRLRGVTCRKFRQLLGR